ALPLRLDLLEAQETTGVGAVHHHLGTGQVEANAQPRADVAVDAPNTDQYLAPAHEDVQAIALRIVDIVFLDAVILVEGELVGQGGARAVGRQDLEGHGDGNATFLPLPVGTAVSLGPAEDHHHVRGVADF